MPPSERPRSSAPLGKYSFYKQLTFSFFRPACWSEEGLGGLIDAGMNIARLNFSHGDHETHGRCIENLNKALASRPGKNVAVMLDTKGPEIRTGLLEDGKAIELIKDSIIKVTTDYEFKGNANAISCSYKGLTTGV